MNIDDIRKEEGEKQYFRELFRRLAEAAKEANSKPLIRKVYDSFSEEMKKDIITVLSRSLETCAGKSIVLTNVELRERKKKEYRRKYKDKLLPKIEAIDYSGWSKATFERRVADPEIRIWKDGKPYFNMDDLDKFSKLILDSSESALCINTHFVYDRKRDGYLPFKSGNYYKIIDQDERVVYLYNERYDATIRIFKEQLKINFRRKEELDF